MLRLEKPSDEVLVGEITIDGKDDSTTTKNSASKWKKRFQQLRVDMTVNEIIAAVGQPDEIRGETEMELIYWPDDMVEIHICTAPKLVTAQCHMDGATLNLL